MVIWVNKISMLEYEERMTFLDRMTKEHIVYWLIIILDRMTKEHIFITDFET